MKALRKLAAADQHLELVEVDDPKPEPGWVVVEVAYAGICGTDLHITHNSFPSWPPVTLGHEFYGRVGSVGAEVEGWSPGDRVVCEPHSLACGRCHLCRRGHAELCARKRSPGWGIDGGMAARVAVPAHLLHRVPVTVGDLAAALCEPTAIAVTAAERMPVEPGSTVVGTRVYSRDDLAVATAMITGGVFDPDPLITRSAALAEAPAAVEDLRAGREVKVLVEGAPVGREGAR